MLRDVLDRVRRDRRTLTLFTRDGHDEVTGRVRRHFAVRNVDVTVRRTDPSDPAGFAVLHDQGECIEAGSLSTLADYLPSDEWESVFDTDRLEEAPARPPLFSAVDDGVYVIDAGSKLPLLRASHQIEHLATNGDSGTLFAGFQQLSNLRDDYGTWDRYRRLSEYGTEVHVFGAPDQQFPDTESPTIHSSDADEIGEMWFLAYLGTEWAGVLIAEQTDATDDRDRYDGFFSFRRDLSETTATYLAETYLGRTDLAGLESDRQDADDATRRD